jgi:hypothetical protein
MSRQQALAALDPAALAEPVVVQMRHAGARRFATLSQSRQSGRFENMFVINNMRRSAAWHGRC